MTLSPDLRRLCLAHPSTVLVPAEALGPRGIEPEMSELLLAEQRLTASQLQALERGFVLYWERCADLSARAPATWLAPRSTNLLIAAEPRGILPYLEPFGGTSSLLYTSDLDTDAEYVAYLLVHMERLALVGSVRAAVALNLSYWFDRDAASRHAFAAAARRATRPDAAGFVALADAFAWIDQMYHIPLREPQQAPTEAYAAIEGADLYLPQRLAPQMFALGDAVEAAVRTAFQVTAPAVVPRTNGVLDGLADWVRHAHAHVIVVAPDGTTVWRPNMDDPSRLRRALAQSPGDAVESIHADLKLVDARSRQFLDAVHNVASLPRHCAVLETGGGAYVDASRRAVVYELKQQTFDARVAAAPPYHRLQLGARVMHEWGHVAHTAKILHVPEGSKETYRQARSELGSLFTSLLAKLPARVRDDVDPDLYALAPNPADLPAALARKTLSRVGDYLANLMSARFIPAEEMQAYVRTNVRHHLDENLGIVSELARYAYEIHYLPLAGIDRSYFFQTSRFPNHYIASGLVAEEDVTALFDAVGRVLACYEIDTERLAIPAAAALSGATA